MRNLNSSKVQKGSESLGSSISIEYHPKHTGSKIILRVLDTRGTAQLQKTVTFAAFCEYPSVTQILYLLKLQGAFSIRRMRGHCLQG